MGIDVVDTLRVERLLAGSTRFAGRWFTTNEIDECRGVNGPAWVYAQRLAAKEAVWKALGLQAWPGGVPWRGIGTSHGTAGLGVELTGRVAEACAGLRIGRIHLSLTHCSGCAIAVAIVEVRSRAPSRGDVDNVPSVDSTMCRGEGDVMHEYRPPLTG